MVPDDHGAAPAWDDEKATAAALCGGRARITHPDHLPPEKVPGAWWAREIGRTLAAEIGPATAQLMETLLAEEVLDRLSRVVRVLKFGELTYPNAQADPRSPARGRGHLGQTLERVAAPRVARLGRLWAKTPGRSRASRPLRCHE